MQPAALSAAKFATLQLAPAHQAPSHTGPTTPPKWKSLPSALHCESAAMQYSPSKHMDIAPHAQFPALRAVPSAEAQARAHVVP